MLHFDPMVCVLDRGVVLIPEGCKRWVFCHIVGESSGVVMHTMFMITFWVNELKSKYAAGFKAGLGNCCLCMVCSFPFHFLLPWKLQSRSPMTGPIEEAKVWEEVFNLVKLGVVREVDYKPYVILALGVSKKNGSMWLALDSRKFNS